MVDPVSTGPKGAGHTARAGTTPRGGAREGAGKNKKNSINFSEAEIRSLIKSSKEMAKKTGRTVGDVLMDHIYNGKAKESLTGIKLFYDNLVSRAQGRGLTPEPGESPIQLPAISPDPAKVVPLKKAEG